ncbi:phage tail tape measure protein [Streptomyces sp. NPDC056112]|uniref:phage tail tape measure protein n=1 Tax=Streptomyces sp. NPDC056112 TaxID=3345715 RepID=UPI0035DFC628
MAQAAARADARLNRVGHGGAAGMRHYRQETGRAREQLKSMAMLLSGGALFMGGADIIKEGNHYQQEMNAFGAVTKATSAQMIRAAATANQLGNDLKLPGATAADAAEAMVELAKAGFRTDQAISATRASLVLASAAQINAADSAKYLGDIMDQFGLGADQAGRAADVLAATSNSASGSITDIYYAMKYAGPVANGLGVSLKDTAAAVGMLGKAGILGQTAGTTLRGMFSNLAAPTQQMKEGLKALGIEAWTSEGKFKGLRVVIDGLAKAQHRMSQKDFAAAVKKSMGKPAMSGAIALAHQGVDSFDALIQALSRSGAASDIAAAKGKGLAGAMLQLKTQARQTGLTIYQGMAPGLEWLARGMTSGLAKATPKIKAFFQYLNDAATLFKPDIAAAVRREFSGVQDAAKGLIAPFKELGGHALAEFFHMLLSVGKAGVDVLKNLAHGVEPVVGALSGLSGEGGFAASTLNLIVTTVDLAARALSGLSGVLVPIGHLVGSLVTAFAGLPGPVQQFILAALLVRRIQGPMNNLATTVSGRVTGAFRSLGQQMAVQRSLAAQAGQSLSRYGAAMAVLQTRIPIIGQMGAAFRGASGQASGFGGALRGVTAAAGAGLKGAMGGLMGAMGGPWGLALTGLTVGLGMLAQHQQEAAQKAAEHKAEIDGLTQAMLQATSSNDKYLRQQVAQTIQNKKLEGSSKSLVDFMGKMGYSITDLTDSYMGHGVSIDKLAEKMHALAEEKIKEASADGLLNRSDEQKAIEAQAVAYEGAAKALSGLSSGAKEAAKNAREVDAATKGNGAGVSAYNQLKDAVGALADRTGDADSRTRALSEALDLLSGGKISFQAAETRLNEAITNANDALGSGVEHANGYGKALLQTNGSLSTTTKNGQQLYNSLRSISQGANEAAVAAFDFAQKQEKDLPTSLAAARKEMEKSRKAAIDLAPAYGLTADQMAQIADEAGLIPGQVAMVLKTEGVDSSLADLLAVQAEFKRVPSAKTIKVNSLDEEAQKSLEDLGYKIEQVPGTREIKITAPTTGPRTDLDLLLEKMQEVPDAKGIKVDVDKAQAVGGLDDVIAKIQATPGAKSVTVTTLNKEAIKALKDVGFTVTRLPNGNVKVTATTGDALGKIGAVKRARDSLSDKAVTITVTTRYRIVGKPGSQVALSPSGGHQFEADGGVVSQYARGGIRPGQVRRFASGAENHVAQVAPAGAWRVWAEPETGGESYIPLAASKRRRSRHITEETVRRLGGNPDGIVWNAGGSITMFDGGGFSYAPPSTMKSISDVMSSYSDAHQPITKDEYNKKIRARANAVDNLRTAEARLAQVRKGKHTHAQLVAAENRVTKARRALATATDAAKKAEARYRKGFSLSDWGSTLSKTVKANATYEANLKKIASRGGSDIIDQLRDMGAEGAKVVAALAKASKKQFNSIVANLRKLGPLAKATLADYTAQLNASNKTDAAFQANLVKLAGMGYGDLASQLAAQGDEAAQKLAAEAVKNKGSAAKANTAAKTSSKQLSDEELGQLVQIIAAITGSKTGIHDVAAKTQLGEDEIIAIANKAKGQIQTSLGSRATKFLSDLTAANKGMAYANGGIRAGIYATQAGLIRFAEPSTGGEAYIPLGQNKRQHAMPVLQDVMRRFGLGVRDASEGRVVIVRESGPLVGAQTWHVTTNGSAQETARRIDADNSYQLRRLSRGGVAAR